MTQRSDARPADVASPEAIVKAVYEVLSGRADESRDWDRWRPLYAPNARLIPIERDSEGTPTPHALALEEYIQSRTPFLAAGDFYEWETGRKSADQEVSRMSGVSMKLPALLEENRSAVAPIAFSFGTMDLAGGFSR